MPNQLNGTKDPEAPQSRLRIGGARGLSEALRDGLAQDEIAWAADQVPGWGPLFVAATRDGICRVDLRPDLDPALSFSRTARDVGASVATRADFLLAPALKQLRAFLEAPRTASLDLPIDAPGSAFQQRVWRALTQIPVGETRSYGDIAKGLDSAARAVGGACGANPVPLLIPCHRVVAAGGALGGFALGLSVKRALLSSEGPAPSLFEMA